MIAEAFKIIEDGETKEPQRRTIEYGGVKYFMRTDHKLNKKYIEVDRERIYLDKNGKIQGKQPGVYTTVESLTLDEVKKFVNVLDKHIELAYTPTEKVLAWRNRTLFICGINVGLRVSDLRMLKWKDLYGKNNEHIGKYVFIAKKTKKRTEIAFNNTFWNAIDTYYKKLFEYKDRPHPEDYVFFGKKNDKEPVSGTQVWRIMDGIAKEAGIEKNIGSHTLRKTFGYTTYRNSKDKNAALNMLMDWYKHSTPLQTMTYIGITFEENKEAVSVLDDVYGDIF